MSMVQLRMLGLLGLSGLIVASYAPTLTTAGQIQPAGVIVNADGVLSTKVFRDPTGELTRRRLREAQTALHPDVARPSELRKISLNRLEAALAARLSAGEFESAEMKYLAGLTRITHVFFYPETNDIVIAGPAEGYFLDISGRPVGMHTGQAVLELQDLVAALRAFPPTGERTSLISVSIDPTADGLQRLQQFLGQVGRQINPANSLRIAQGVQEALGHQVISIRGVSDKTHFAQVLVEADYRMKLMSIGLEQPPVDIVSYVARVNPGVVARNALARFYFTPNYECVRVAEDGLAMQMTGRGVKLVCEHELITGDGNRVESKNENKAAEEFAASFTERYEELARRAPVYAQMRNLIDMSIAAAFIQQQDYYAQADWRLGVMGDERAMPLETYTAPRFVDSAVNAIIKGNRLMTPIGGGVNIQPRQALVEERLQRDADGSLKSQRDQISLQRLAAGQWWWD
jgi:hypothetical protein